VTWKDFKHRSKKKTGDQKKKREQEGKTTTSSLGGITKAGPEKPDKGEDICLCKGVGVVGEQTQTTDGWK